jgi:hypothetical protein
MKNIEILNNPAGSNQRNWESLSKGRFKDFRNHDNESWGAIFGHTTFNRSIRTTFSLKVLKVVSTTFYEAWIKSILSVHTYHIFLQCHKWPISFCKEARDLMASLFAPKKRKQKKSWNLIFDLIHSHHRVTIRISMHIFLIFHGYVSKHKDIWPIFGNKP